MDCSGCAATLKKAVERMPGASDVAVSLTKETMTLLLDEGATDIAAIEKKVRQLGFQPQLSFRPAIAASGHVHRPDCSHEHAARGNADPKVVPASTFSDRLVWELEGIDCKSCAATISHALQRLPGISNVQVSVSNETLTLGLDERSTNTSAVEAKLNALGYAARRVGLATQGNEGESSPAPVRRWWWQSPKARIAATAGMLLVAAYLASVVFPPLSNWAFLLATIACGSRCLPAPAPRWW